MEMLAVGPCLSFCLSASHKESLCLTVHTYVCVCLSLSILYVCKYVCICEHKTGCLSVHLSLSLSVCLSLYNSLPPDRPVANSVVSVDLSNILSAGLRPEGGPADVQ